MVMVMKHVRALRRCSIEASNQMLSILWAFSKFMLATQHQFRRNVRCMLRLKERDCWMNTLVLDILNMNKFGQKDYLSLPRKIGYGHSTRVYNIHCNSGLSCILTFTTLILLPMEDNFLRIFFFFCLYAIMMNNEVISIFAISCVFILHNICRRQ